MDFCFIAATGYQVASSNDKANIEMLARCLTGAQTEVPSGGNNSDVGITLRDYSTATESEALRPQNREPTLPQRTSSSYTDFAAAGVSIHPSHEGHEGETMHHRSGRPASSVPPTVPMFKSANPVGKAKHSSMYKRLCLTLPVQLGSEMCSGGPQPQVNGHCPTTPIFETGGLLPADHKPARGRGRSQQV